MRVDECARKDQPTVYSQSKPKRNNSIALQRQALTALCKQHKTDT